MHDGKNYQMHCKTSVCKAQSIAHNRFKKGHKQVYVQKQSKLSFKVGLAVIKSNKTRVVVMVTNTIDFMKSSSDN